MSRAQATPVLIRSDSIRVELEHIHLGNGTYDEDWLQRLIHFHPAILPVSAIEPGFGELIAAAREVPCGHGFIDNLYLTASGDIVLVEAKLWRNTQMRREVVAQALDYVAAITAMSFDAFEAAVRRGLNAPTTLYDLVRDKAEALEEADFIDAIARNLKRGRVLVMVVGDGIRSETELLSDLLQSHAGSHFTFALVEVAIWRNRTTADILAVPSTLMKTVMVERGVVRVEHGDAVVLPIPSDGPTGPQTITSSDFWEAISQRNPALPATIRSFLDALEPLGVYPDLKASLNIKADLPNRAKPINFGYITKNGQFWTDPVSGYVPEPVWRTYFQTLADLIGGQISTGTNKYVSVGERSAPRIEQFLPAHQNAVVSAIETMLRALSTLDE